MDKTVNNNNIANPTIDDLNAEKPAENTDNSTKNINMESIRCDNNSAVFQQNEQNLRADCYMVGFFQTEPSVRHMVCLRRCYNDHQ